MSLKIRRERYIIPHYMWKIINNVTSCLALVLEIWQRTKESITTTTFHLSAYESSFAGMDPKFWNCIPYNLNVVTDIDSFKSQLTKALMTIPDTPPVRGYIVALKCYNTSNSNSLLDWNNKKAAAFSEWSDRTALLKIRKTQQR